MSGPETGSLARNRTVDVVHSINNGIDEGLRLANRTWSDATGANEHFSQGACREDKSVASRPRRTDGASCRCVVRVTLIQQAEHHAAVDYYRSHSARPGS